MYVEGTKMFFVHREHFHYMEILLVMCRRKEEYLKALIANKSLMVGGEFLKVEVAFEEMMKKSRHDVRTLSEHEIQMV